MFRLLLPRTETWNEETEEFVTYGGVEIELEHSLYTVSLWEQRWMKPFFGRKSLGRKELMYYIISCMCQTKGVKKEDWLMLTTKNIKEITDYMANAGCATTLNPRKSNKAPSRNRPQTAEVIYAEMFHFGIPMECEHWHINRLLTLIGVCADLETPPTKMSKGEALAQQKLQNERMRAKYNSRG